jgi:hypothetical protein
LLECLRYVLDIPPKEAGAQTHLEIIKGIWRGPAESRWRSFLPRSMASAIAFRRYGEMPIVRGGADGSGNVSTLQPRDLLPGIDIYQNEIYELAQDEQSRIIVGPLPANDGDYTQHNVTLKSAWAEISRSWSHWASP